MAKKGGEKTREADVGMASVPDHSDRIKLLPLPHGVSGARCAASRCHMLLDPGTRGNSSFRAVWKGSWGLETVFLWLLVALPALCPFGERSGGSQGLGGKPAWPLFSFALDWSDLDAADLSSVELCPPALQSGHHQLGA